MVVVIIALFMVVVFALGHYAKLFWWRRSSQSQSQSRSITDLGTGTGLDPSILRCLPISILQRQDSSKDDLVCSVCLCEFVEGEKLRILPECNHVFHVNCVDLWFQSKNTCPLCRNIVVATPSRSYRTSNNTAKTISRHEGMWVIDIPGHTEEEPPSSSSPFIRGLRSLQRLLSKYKLNPWSPASTETRRRRSE